MSSRDTELSSLTASEKPPIEAFVFYFSSKDDLSKRGAVAPGVLFLWGLYLQKGLASCSSPRNCDHTSQSTVFE